MSDNIASLDSSLYDLWEQVIGLGHFAFEGYVSERSMLENMGSILRTKPVQDAFRKCNMATPAVAGIDFKYTVDKTGRIFYRVSFAHTHYKVHVHGWAKSAKFIYVLDCYIYTWDPVVETFVLAYE